MTFKGNLRPQKDVKIMTDDSILLLWLLWLKFQPAVLYIIVSYYIILYRYFKISQVWYIKYRLFVFLFADSQLLVPESSSRPFLLQTGKNLCVLHQTCLETQARAEARPGGFSETSHIAFPKRTKSKERPSPWQHITITTSKRMKFYR